MNRVAFNLSSIQQEKGFTTSGLNFAYNVSTDEVGCFHSGHVITSTVYLFIDLFADQERRKINKGDREEERTSKKC